MWLFVMQNFVVFRGQRYLFPGWRQVHALEEDAGLAAGADFPVETGEYFGNGLVLGFKNVIGADEIEVSFLLNLVTDRFLDIIEIEQPPLPFFPLDQAGKKIRSGHINKIDP